MKILKFLSRLPFAVCNKSISFNYGAENCGFIMLTSIVIAVKNHQFQPLRQHCETADLCMQYLYLK